MGWDPASVRRREQELLACVEGLQLAKQKAQRMLDGVRKAWNAKETVYLEAALT